MVTIIQKVNEAKGSLAVDASLGFVALVPTQKFGQKPRKPTLTSGLGHVPFFIFVLLSRVTARVQSSSVSHSCASNSVRFLTPWPAGYGTQADDNNPLL